MVVEIKDRNSFVKGRTLTYTGKSYRTAFIGLEGKLIAGYTGKKEETAIEEACMNALKRYMGGIANEFPVTGNITAMLRSRMSMDKGVEQGLAKKTQLCIWAEQGGVAVPLAYAEAEPGEHGSSLVVYRWNEKDIDAGPMIREIREIPNWINLPGNKLYATSVGLPPPPEWGGE